MNNTTSEDKPKQTKFLGLDNVSLMVVAAIIILLFLVIYPKTARKMCKYVSKFFCCCDNVTNIDPLNTSSTSFSFANTLTDKGLL